VSLLPTAVLVLLVVSLWAGGAPGQAPELAQVLGGPEGLDVSQLVGILLVVLVIALVLHPLQLTLVQLFEGYWGISTLGRSLSALGVELHRRRQQRLLQVTAESGPNTRRYQWAVGQLRMYPIDSSHLMPTKLGNALRAAEDQAGERYGLSTVVTLPRLYPQLSGPFAQVYMDLRNQLDIAVRFCATLLLATVICAVLLREHGWWLALPAATALLSWMAYRASVRAGAAYGQGLYIAFDLFRFDLLQALHYPLPVDPVQEKRFNSALSKFFVSNYPLEQRLGPVAYEHPAPASDGLQPLTPPGNDSGG
jgi:hypothetical protein